MGKVSHNKMYFVLGRDFPYLRQDTNKASLIEVVSEIRQSNNKDAADWLKANKDCKLNSTLDFGRPVHAEMSAIMACARGGVATQGAFMFVTTFPCQNCAKNIIAAGITRVYFIEPYPKSLALELHDDAIFLNDELKNSVAERVELRPYVGIGPRRFFDLFALNSGNGINLKRKDDTTGKAFEWPRDRKKIRSDSIEGWFPRLAIPRLS